MKSMNYKSPNQRKIESPQNPGFISYDDVVNNVNMEEFGNPENDIDHEIVILDDIPCPFNSEDSFNEFIDECDPIEPHELHDSFELRYLNVRDFMLSLIEA